VNSLHGKEISKTSNLKKDHGGFMIKKVIISAAAGTFILSGILAGAANTKQSSLDPMATPTPTTTPKEKKKKDKKETPSPSESPTTEPSPAESPTASPTGTPQF